MPARLLTAFRLLERSVLEAMLATFLLVRIAFFSFIVDYVFVFRFDYADILSL